MPEHKLGYFCKYNMGLITITNVTKLLMFGHLPIIDRIRKNIREDQQGFNSVYMMLDSGAKGSKNKFVS
jgi:DNA-directed RNA polymerase subunit beta'